MAGTELLDSFDLDATAMTAAELIKRSGLPRSSAFRELKLLVESGYLYRDPVTKMYSLGTRILQLGIIARHHLSAEEHITAPLMELLNRLGETVTFSLLDLPWRTCTYVLEAPSDLRQVVRIGARYPLHQGAAGKVILANLAEPVARSVLAGERLSGREIDAIMKETQTTRESGYIVTTGERVEGASSLAAPVFVGDIVYGSVAVAGPSERALAAIRGNEALVVGTAREVSVRLFQAQQDRKKKTRRAES